MSILERLIPDSVLDWSLHFKTVILVSGGVILLFSSYIRPEVSILIWGPVFLFGALIEWLVIATVYLEMKELEEKITRAKSEITDAKSEIRSTKKDIDETQHEIRETQTEVESTKEDIFSSISDSRNSAFNNIEDRISGLEREVGVGPNGRGTKITDEISDIHDTLRDMKRNRR